MKEFLKKKNVSLSAKVYFIDALGKMAFGLFAWLLIGTILNTIGSNLNIPFLSKTVWPIASDMTGPTIAVAIAVTLKAPNLVLFASLIPGYYANQLGGPVGVFFSIIVAVEIGKIISGETPIDIVLTPMVVIIVGMIVGYYIGRPVGVIMTSLGKLIMKATELKPIFMGIVVSVIVGMALTLPISSAALCMMLSLSGLAAGAAIAGCCAQMVGFAVISYKENKMRGLLGQGLGTSMLQISNIIRNWRIWIPPTLAAAITGPIATTIFKMGNSPMGAGMGTSGLVGIIETLRTMQITTVSVIGVLLCYIILPAVLSYVFYKILYNKNLIKDGDMKLQD